MNTRQTGTRPTREKDGMLTGIGGLVIAAAGLGINSPAVIAIGVVLALIGAIMWAVGMNKAN